MATCEACEGRLRRVEADDGEEVFLCENADECEAGKGCNVAVPASEVKRQQACKVRDDDDDDDDDFGGSDASSDEDEDAPPKKKVKQKPAADVKGKGKAAAGKPAAAAAAAAAAGPSSVRAAAAASIAAAKAKVEKAAAKEKADVAAGKVIPLVEGNHSKDDNVCLLKQDNLCIRRQPLLPGLLTVTEAKLRAPFKNPLTGAIGPSAALQQRLMAAKAFVPWGSRDTWKPPLLAPPPLPAAAEPEATAAEDEPVVEPLELYSPTPEEIAEGATPVVVDRVLTKFLRQHQREGVAFMFECIAGLREFEGHGCILADDMGLGKTLQAITLMWTALTQGLKGKPMARRALVVCPTSLVGNWESECVKWLNGRVRTLALAEACRADVIDGIQRFLTPASRYQVLIISYETFRLHAERFAKEGSCDLLICDEAHRLKNDETLTNQALNALVCSRRILLSGTPLQNDLGEFYAMVNFCNPNVLGTIGFFRKTFANPILRGREPDASDAESTEGTKRSSELSTLVNDFILRRTNVLLSAHLPPKVIEIVCCTLSPLQELLYQHFLSSKAARAALNSSNKAKALAAITALRNLCQHPKLIWDAMMAAKSSKKDAAADGFANCEELFPVGLFDRAGRMSHGWELHSGKFAVLARLLETLRRTTDDRIVLVSNYTSTLELMAQLCRERGYPYVKLDGSTSISKRNKLVKLFCDPTQNQFVFLLSSKAGGCGLNLIGGNRLILFDPDWNPATDKQAAARVWRDGQRKRVFVYRFLSTGTIEEKVYQRQLSKEGLQAVVGEGGSDKNIYSESELKQLFKLNVATRSDTHDGLLCSRCPAGICARSAAEEAGACAGAAGGGDGAGGAGGAGGAATGQVRSGLLQDARVLKPFVPPRAVPKKPAVNADEGDQVEDGPPQPPPPERQVGNPEEADLLNWGHHRGCATVPDPLFASSGGAEVSFVFTCEVAGMKVEEPSGKPMPQMRTLESTYAAARMPLRPLNGAAPMALHQGAKHPMGGGGGAGPSRPSGAPISAPYKPPAACGPRPSPKSAPAGPSLRAAANATPAKPATGLGKGKAHPVKPHVKVPPKFRVVRAGVIDIASSDTSSEDEDSASETDSDEVDEEDKLYKTGRLDVGDDGDDGAES